MAGIRLRIMNIMKRQHHEPAHVGSFLKFFL